jgi:CspA family cold shock protein
VNGTIVRIVSDKGFFFIKGEDNRQYFAHKSCLITAAWIYDIMEGDEVLFIAAEHEKGPRAEQVVVKRLCQRIVARPA